MSPARRSLILPTRSYGRIGDWVLNFVRRLGEMYSNAGRGLLCCHNRIRHVAVRGQRNFLTNLICGLKHGVYLPALQEL